MVQVKQVVISGDHASKLALYDLDGNGTLSDTEKMMMKYDTSAPYGQFSIAEVKGIVNDLKYTEKAKQNLSRVIVGLVVLLLIILGANMVLTFLVVDMAKDTETSPDGVTRVKGGNAVAKTGLVSEKSPDFTPTGILESTHKNEDFLRSTEYFSWSEEGTNTISSVLLAGFEVTRTAVLETSHKFVTVLLHTTAPNLPVLAIGGVLDEDGRLVGEIFFHKSREVPDIFVKRMLSLHSDPELLKSSLERSANRRKLLVSPGYEKCCDNGCWLSTPSLCNAACTYCSWYPNGPMFRMDQGERLAKIEEDARIRANSHSYASSDAFKDDIADVMSWNWG